VYFTPACRSAAHPEFEDNGRAALSNAVDVHDAIVYGEELTGGGVAFQVSVLTHDLVNTSAGESKNDQAHEADQ
jgi:hypothetical protein